jgi:hypothetical protein
VASEVPPEHGIAMWGAPSSGKTTFLAALNIALTRRDDGWKVVGTDEASAETLIGLTTALTRDRTFPLATQGIEHYRWQLVGRVARTIRRGRFRRERREEVIKIRLDLADARGELAAPDQASRGVRADLIDNLVRSRGIVFLFDPVREFTLGDAFDYTYGVLAQLAQRMVDSPEFSDGWLPHYVAVCVTKFDEIRVYETADKLDLLVTDLDDPYEFPRVADDQDARHLFARLCEVSRSGNADLVLNTLEQHFRPERIKYFVSSAIGFYVDPRAGVYDPADFQNLVPDPDDPGRPLIRGAVHPINVVEPMLWLGERLAEPGA